MDLMQAFLWGVAAPVAAATAVYCWVWRREILGGAGSVALRRERAGGALAVAAAFLVGFVGVHGWPAMPPSGVVDGLPWIAVFAGLLCFVRPALRAATGKFSRALGDVPLALRMIGSIAICGFLLRGPIDRAAGAGELTSQILIVIFCAAALSIHWSASNGIVEFLRPADAAFLYMACAAAASVVLLLTGSALLAQLAGAVAAALGPAWILALWRGAPALGGGTVGAALCVLASLCFAGHFFGELTWGPIIAIAAAPLAATVAVSASSGLASPRAQSLVAVLLGFALLLLGILLAGYSTNWGQE